ncbi:hypothetical protein ACQPZX_02630 [Actinoplanes sp. CA-142083]|uniref:hypothetical protein n=1 Tax=Actinoplanes sp. CA-142083 TaxID=3239903 RepID=UPI003D8A2E3A
MLADSADEAMMAPLVRAAWATDLSRFEPYISMFLLCFEAGPGDTLPLSIGVAADPDVYIVWWGVPWLTPRCTAVEITGDAREAATLAEQLLSWR